MENQLGFLLKLLLLSALLSLLIKYSGAFLTIPATATNATFIVLLPTLVMIAVLLWRLPKQEQS
ncbi:MAG TPA: hypothetical protein VK203_04160 [Nostocaceae cyanobacterium]|nr:hypothetical protein [Nostocaceae cyanobacterium]